MRLACLLPIVLASVWDKLFLECDPRGAMLLSPVTSEDVSCVYVMLRLFENDPEQALYTLLSGEKNSEPLLLIVARSSPEDLGFLVSESARAQILKKLCREISEKYLLNRYAFSEPILLEYQTKEDLDDILTTVWSANATIIEKFFDAISRNHIKAEDTVSRLEFLAGKKEKKAFGFLGDIYYYGLGAPVDTEKALEYYMAGKALHDTHSMVGIARILAVEPFNDCQQALKILDEVSSAEKDAEAIYLQYLLMKRLQTEQETMQGAPAASKIFPGNASQALLQNAGFAGYLPAVNDIASQILQMSASAQAITSYMSISQYSPFFQSVYDRAFEAYSAKEYKRSLLYYLYLSEFSLDIATRNAIFILTLHDPLDDSDRILFGLYSKLANKNKKYLKNIGDLYYYGRGVQQSKETAFACYMCSIDHSDESLYNVAYMYENGDGIPRDLTAAYRHISSYTRNSTVYLVVLYTKIRIALKMVLTGHPAVWNAHFVAIFVCLLSLFSTLFFLSERNK